MNWHINQQFICTSVLLKQMAFIHSTTNNIIHVCINTLCTGCLGNKLPYHVLQLRPHFGQPIYLPTEMGWKLWIMTIFQSKRNKPLIAMWPLQFQQRAQKRAAALGKSFTAASALFWFQITDTTNLVWAWPPATPPLLYLPPWPCRENSNQLTSPLSFFPPFSPSFLFSSPPYSH